MNQKSQQKKIVVQLQIEKKLGNDFLKKYPKASLSLFLESKLQLELGHGYIAKFQEAVIENGIEVSYK